MRAPLFVKIFNRPVLFTKVLSEFAVADFAVAGVPRADLIIDMPGNDVIIARVMLNYLAVNSLSKLDKSGIIVTNRIAVSVIGRLPVGANIRESVDICERPRAAVCVNRCTSSS